MSFTPEAVLDEVLKIFKAHTTGGVTVEPSSHVVADLGIDSLGVMEVVAELEDAFKLTIPDDALREVDTVEDVAAAIEVRLAAKASAPAKDRAS